MVDARGRPNRFPSPAETNRYAYAAKKRRRAQEGLIDVLAEMGVRLDGLPDAAAPIPLDQYSRALRLVDQLGCVLTQHVATRRLVISLPWQAEMNRYWLDGYGARIRFKALYWREYEQALHPTVWQEVLEYLQALAFSRRAYTYTTPAGEHRLHRTGLTDAQGYALPCPPVATGASVATDSPVGAPDADAPEPIPPGPW